jgi:hypothetical protein
MLHGVTQRAFIVETYFCCDVSCYSLPIIIAAFTSKYVKICQIMFSCVNHIRSDGVPLGCCAV